MGPDDSATKAAQKQQQAQQQQIAAGTAAVNNVFDDPARQAQYDKLASDTTAYYTNQLDQQKAVNDRQMKFALARNGQTGGSVSTDQATQAGKDYETGVLNAARMGNQASASLQSQDQQERASLISAVQGGLDATTAANNAASALKTDAAGAQANATTNSLGQAFGDMSSIWQNSQNNKALRQGQLYSYNTVYQPGFGAGQQPYAAGNYGSFY